ncbi:hypothetical protein SDC9_91061 [bioreactor metagenome]|uniref:Uncharacterized protein n=1 Tax=bioreactor metagenome TaxID=1076179 RepID=A0A645A0K4_9ZZZZ
MEQKRQNALLRDDKPGLRAGSLIRTRVILPNMEFENRQKIFVVKQVRGDGRFTAYAFTSHQERTKYATSFAVKADEVNLLYKDSVVQVSPEYDFPADWNYTKMHGVLTPVQMTELMLLQESYKEKNIIEKIEVNQKQADELREVRAAVQRVERELKKDPKKLIDYLAFSSKFYLYSPRNLMLLYAQNPRATFTAGKGRYQRMGYRVKPGAQSIQILRKQTKEYFERNGYLIPVMKATNAEKAKLFAGKIEVVQKTYFEAVDIYDITQTTCPEKDYPKVYGVEYTSDQHAELFDQLKELSELSGVPVEIKDLTAVSLRGLYNPQQNTITISPLLQSSERLGTMCNEYARALLHRTTTQSPAVEVFEAQCLATMLSGRFGLPINENDKKSMAKNLEEAQKDPKFKLEVSLARVQKQLRYIDKRIDIPQLLEEELGVQPMRQQRNFTAPEPGFQPPHRGGGRT